VITVYSAFSVLGKRRIGCEYFDGLSVAGVKVAAKAE
jgi:hypothetical protein